MSLHELLPPAQDDIPKTSEVEVIDPAEHYLRLCFEDTDLAEKYLETIFTDSIKRLAIYANAISIISTHANIEAGGEAVKARLERRIEHYKELFHSYLERENIEPVEPTPERSRIRSLVDKIIRR